MNNEKTPRKEMIKNIAIIFLAVLLVLTFFSNTIMNYSLPQVSVVSASRNTISEQIRGSGTISAAENYEVKFEQSRDIKSVAVKAGQTVAAGDVLFELEDKDSTELTEAQDELEKLELDYKKSELALASKGGYESEYMAISSAEKELDRLREKLAEAESGKDDLSVANDKYKTSKAEVTKLTAEKDKLTAELASVDTDDMLDLKGDRYKRMRAAKDNVAECEKTAEKKKTEYDELVKELGSDVDYGDQIISKKYEVDMAREELNQLYINLYKADPETDTSDISVKIASQQVTLTHLEQELEGLSSKASSGNVSKSKRKNAESSMKKAQNKLTEAKEKLASTAREVKLEIKAELSKINDKLGKANEDMANAEEMKGEAAAEGLMSAAQLTAKINEKEEALEKLRNELTVKQNSDSAENMTARLDLEAKQSAIEKQKKKIEKLKGDSYDSVIKAKMGGVVESVSVTAGSNAAAGTVAAVINVSDKGYQLEFSVKTEQAKKVKIGDKAEITSWYWGENFSAVLSEIRPDTTNPQSNKILVFTVTGSDISTGQTITLSMGSKGQPYDSVVPNSAVREDSNGKFVLVMESKSSPLGNRYKAVRYDVQVLAKDDNYTAVSGLSGNGNEFVITTSTKPISPGEQVRPAE